MNKKVQKSMAIMLTAIFVIMNIAHAQDININMLVKGQFSLGETISFDYNIITGSREQVVFIASVECPTAPIPPTMKKTARVGPKNPYSGTYDYLTIEDYIEPQTCTAYVQITSPVHLRKEKTFRIETLPPLDFEVNVCGDTKCREKEKIFTKWNTIYLDYKSAVKPAIDANLILPDRTKKHIPLPYSFKAKQPGTYTLAVKASKEGYRSAEQTIQFGVIEKEPEIPQAKEKISFAIRVCEEEKWVESPPAAKTKKTCIEPKTEFETGQKIVIYSETTAKIKAKITYPNKTTKTLTLPTNLELKQKGTYIIEATAEKTGWKKTTKIATIEVKEAGKPSGKQPVNFTLIAGGIITVMVILGIIILIKLKK